MQNVVGGRCSVGAVASRTKARLCLLIGAGVVSKNRTTRRSSLHGARLESAALPCLRTARCTLRAIFDVLPRTARLIDCRRRDFREQRSLHKSDDTEVVPPLEGAAPSAPWNCIDGGVRVAEGWRYGRHRAAATGSSEFA
jgi:hypothetical protein